MDSAMKSMNLEKISTLMDKFEKEFEDLDVQTSVMEGAMSQTTATNIPTDSVDILMKQAADEAGIELSHELPSAASNTIGTAQQVFKLFWKTIINNNCLFKKKKLLCRSYFLSYLTESKILTLLGYPSSQASA